MQHNQSYYTHISRCNSNSNSNLNTTMKSVIRAISLLVRSIRKKDRWIQSRYDALMCLDWKDNVLYMSWPSGYEQHYRYNNEDKLVRFWDNEKNKAHYTYVDNELLSVTHKDKEDAWVEEYDKNTSI